MKLRFLLRAALFVALFCSMTDARATDPLVYRKLAAWYKGRDPVADAAKNFDKGDIFVISAMGAGTYYPGLKYEEAERLLKKHDERPIRLASDVIEGKDHEAYVTIAVKYATAYNQATMKLLKDAGRE